MGKINLLTENDFNAIQAALDDGRPFTLAREFGTVRIAVEVQETGKSAKVWNVPYIIQFRKMDRNIFSIQNFKSVEEMRWYLG